MSVGLLANSLLEAIGLISPESDSVRTEFHFISCVFYAAIVLVVLFVWKHIQLADTDQFIARKIIARRAAAYGSDLAVDRVANIAEEMAVAAGIAAPTVYIWNEDRIVNALAVGSSEADAAIFVSRGAIDALTRDEMQVLLGYGMSQILNGDLSLNVRLASCVYAFKFAPRVANYFLAFPWQSKGFKRFEAMFYWLFICLWIGLALGLATYPQWLAVRLLHVSIGRQRQKLADASALQFSRNPGAQEGLFVKALVLGTAAHPSRLLEDLAHGCFAAPLPQRGLLRMHRPFEKRLLALNPSFDFTRIPELRREILQQIEARAVQSVENEALAGRAEQLRHPLSMVEKIGGFMPLLAALDDRAALPGALGAALDPRTLLIALLLDTRTEIRHQQLAAVRKRYGDESILVLAESMKVLRPLNASERTVALDSHLPALRLLSPAELERLAETLREFEALDDSIDIFEYAITRRALVFIRDLLKPRGPHGRRLLTDFVDELQLVFSVFARHSAPGTERAAYEKGMRRLSMGLERVYQPTAHWGRPLDAALEELEQLKPVAKELLLEGLQATLQFDQNEGAAERELLRVIAASLGYPVPR